MSFTCCTLASSVNWFVNCRLILSSHLIDLVKDNFLIEGWNSSLNRSPERCVPSLCLVLMIEGEKSCVTYNTMIKASWHLIPQPSCKRPFHSFVIDKKLLKRWKWGIVLKLLGIGYWLRGCSWKVRSFKQSLFGLKSVQDRKPLQYRSYLHYYYYVD